MFMLSCLEPCLEQDKKKTFIIITVLHLFEKTFFFFWNLVNFLGYLFVSVREGQFSPAMSRIEMEWSSKM